MGKKAIANTLAWSASLRASRLSELPKTDDLKFFLYRGIAC
jgi:hypothetical protein